MVSSASKSLPGEKSADADSSAVSKVHHPIKIRSAEQSGWRLQPRRNQDGFRGRSSADPMMTMMMMSESRHRETMSSTTMATAMSTRATTVTSTSPVTNAAARRLTVSPHFLRPAAHRPQALRFRAAHCYQDGTVDSAQVETGALTLPSFESSKKGFYFVPIDDGARSVQDENQATLTSSVFTPPSGRADACSMYPVSACNKVPSKDVQGSKFKPQPVSMNRFTSITNTRILMPLL
jgi:hypothetical protein